MGLPGIDFSLSTSKTLENTQNQTGANINSGIQFLPRDTKSVPVSMGPGISGMGLSFIGMLVVGGIGLLFLSGAIIRRFF